MPPAPPLAFLLTGGEAADCTQFETLSALAETRPGYLIADNAYDSDAIRDHLHDAGVRPVISPRSDAACGMQLCKQGLASLFQRPRIARFVAPNRVESLKIRNSARHVARRLELKLVAH